MAVWIDALAVGLAASRMLTNIFPASGHVVLLLYTLLVTKQRTYRLLAGAYFVVTLGAKFILWHDFITPMLGGIVAWALWKWRSSATATRPC